MPKRSRPLLPVIDALKHAVAVAELLAQTEPEEARAILAVALRKAQELLPRRP